MRVSPHAVLQKLARLPFDRATSAAGAPTGRRRSGFQAKPVPKERLTRRRVAFLQDPVRARMTGRIRSRGLPARRPSKATSEVRYGAGKADPDPVATDHGCG